MSRRNSSSRRRNYGRRLHEMNERRSSSGSIAFDWLAEADEPASGASGLAGGRLDGAYLDGGSFDGARLRDARGRAA